MKFRHKIAALCFFIAGVGNAAPSDVTIKVGKEFIEERLEDQIVDQFEKIVDDIRRDYDPGLPKLNVSVSALDLRRMSSSTIDASIEIKAQSSIGDSNDFFLSRANMSFSFGCRGLDLDVGFRLKNLDVLAIPFPSEDINTIERTVNQKISMKLGDLSKDLEENLPLPSKLRCPKIQVNSDASLKILMDLSALECSEGRIKYSQCNLRMIGEGSKYQCRNGYWQRISYDCRPCRQNYDCPNNPKDNDRPPTHLP